MNFKVTCLHLSGISFTFGPLSSCLPVWGQCSCRPAGPEQPARTQSERLIRQLQTRDGIRPSAVVRQAGKGPRHGPLWSVEFTGVWIAEPPGQARLFLFSDSMETKGFCSSDAPRTPAPPMAFHQLLQPRPCGLPRVSEVGPQGKVSRGGGEDVWWRRCGRSGGRQLSAPRATTEPRGLGPPEQPQALCPLQPISLFSRGVSGSRSAPGRPRRL